MYREPLPEGCPPDAAEEIATAREVFRLVSGQTVGDDDFRSQRAEKPNAVFRVTECEARGVSVFADRRDADERARRLPKFKGYFTCRVMLKPGAGRIQQTFRPSHHTWWPFAAFNILVDGEPEIV
jgi:hypothetical protein